MKILRLLYFADWRFFVVCGNNRYNEAMDTIASLITQEQVERESLKYQLTPSFQNFSDGEQLKVVKKAKEDCLHVCNVIASGNGEELFESMMSVQRELFDGAVQEFKETDSEPLRSTIPYDQTEENSPTLRKSLYMGNKASTFSC